MVNEAMNSGCAVVVSDAIGAAGYLIRRGENGCVYPNGNVDELYRQVKTLLEEPQRMSAMGEKACRTIMEQWNGEVAAQRLMALISAMLDGKKDLDLYPDGPGSRHIL